MIGETKLDSSFPESQFLIEGFQKPYRLDVTSRSGGLLAFVKSHLPSRQLLNFVLPKDIQIINFELNLRKEKWLVVVIYKPPSQSVPYFLEWLSKLLDFYNTLYEKHFIVGDFNITPESKGMTDFLNNHNYYNLIKGNTCFKGVGSCIDLILTNQKYCFKNTNIVETGLSDHPLLIYTMLKSTFPRSEPQIVINRDYKKFSNEKLTQVLSNELQNTTSYNDFENKVTEVLNQHAPPKMKYLRGNHKPHVSKHLRKAIMNRTRLKNIANRTGKEKDIAKYRKQRNFVVNLNKKEKRIYFNSLSVHDSKPFWKRCKKYFSNKGIKTSGNIILLDEDNLVLNEKQVAKNFNEHFQTITNSLGLSKWPELEGNWIAKDHLFYIIKKYEKHPSIINIKKNYSTKIFSFKYISYQEICDTISSLDPKKAQGGNIPCKILKNNEVIAHYICRFVNECLISGEFPDNLKLATVTPIHKKDDPFDKNNYRPISILPLISKIFEKIIYKQVYKYMDTYLSPLLCGFRKTYSTQHALYRLLHSWQHELDQSGYVGTILMDLSKAYDCLPHDLIIAKLEAYGFDYISSKLFLNYLCNRKQQVKVGSKLSDWVVLSCGVPQGSVLGPLIFNIFINDLVLFIQYTSLCNFADDNTLYKCSPNIELVIDSLEKDANNMLKWFNVNSLKANPTKFQFMIMGENKEIQFKCKIGDKYLYSKNNVVLLGIIIDKKLKFDEHITSLCNKATYKLYALQRIRKFITISQAKLLASSFINSQFNYCSIIWMFCSKKMKLKMENIHKRALRVVYNEYDHSYDKLLLEHNVVSIHQSHLKTLALEIYKTTHDLNPEFMKLFFNAKENPYQLRAGSRMSLPQTSSIRHGINSITFRGSLLWNTLPSDIKQCNTLSKFKKKIKKEKLECNCVACRF